MARLRAAGTPVHVTLVGDGDARGQLEAAIARLGIAQDVTITGWADEAEVRAHIVAARDGDAELRRRVADRGHGSARAWPPGPGLQRRGDGGSRRQR
ncbi:hypothetical protein [Sphingomonas sp. LR55]|uniref:hypothetical protein n=1 Tax=Sphingomonas sp. LR55 TaxID=3050231 RepID=UPI002FE0A399